MVDILTIADAGKHQDDELMLILATRLYRQGLIRPLAVVANLAPALMRARLVKGQLEQLQMPIPVGVGSDCGGDACGHEHEFDAVPYLAAAADVVDGSDLLASTLAEAGDRSVTLLLTSGMTDAARLVVDRQPLFTQKVKEVVIMGGVNTNGDEVALDAGGFMTPDSAANNNFDPQAARTLYRKLQELGVPMVILTRHAGYAAMVPRLAYERMEATGHPVGVKLATQHRRLADYHWQMATLPEDHPLRIAEHVPARWNKRWFCEAFCGGDGMDRGHGDRIADLVKHEVFSDPMALVAAVPCLRERFFSPCAVAVGGVVHKVIGLSPAVTGVLDGGALVAYMVDQIVSALAEARPLPPEVFIG